MDIEQLKELLKSLSSEDLQNLKDYVGTLLSASDSKEEVEESETSNSGEEIEAESADENATDEEASNVPVEDTKEAEEVQSEEMVQTPDNELKEEPGANTDESVKGIQEVEAQNEETEDDIPSMQKVVPTEVSEDNSDEVVSDEGDSIPVDYEQIVEGLNAKIAALEAENANLKSKVDGAFGYSAKTSIPAKINRLYDDCSDVHFHK